MKKVDEILLPKTPDYRKGYKYFKGYGTSGLNIGLINTKKQSPNEVIQSLVYMVKEISEVLDVKPDLEIDHFMFLDDNVKEEWIRINKKNIEDISKKFVLLKDRFANDLDEVKNRIVNLIKEK